MNLTQGIGSIGETGAEKLGNAYVDLGVNIQPLNAGLLLGLSALEGYFVSAYAKIDTQMRNIWTIANISEEQLRGIQNEILALTREVPQSAMQLTSAFYQIVSSGIDSADAMGVLEVAAKAASAGMTNTETAVKGIVYVLKAFNLNSSEAGEVSDTMFKAVEKGIFTYEELASTVGHYMNTASALKISYKDVIAAQAAMSLTGLNAAESATALNQVLTAFIKPSEQMQAFVEKQGYATGEAMIQTLGLVESMERFALAADVAQQAGGGYATETLKFFTNVRAGRGALALMRQDAEAFGKIQYIVGDAIGAADAAYAKQSGSIENNVKKLGNSVTEVSVKMGEVLAPGVNAAVEGVTNFLNMIADLDPDSFKIIQATAGLAVVAGAMSKLGGITEAIPSLMNGILSLFTAANPVGWVVLGGAAVLAIHKIYLEMTDWEGKAKDAAKANDDLLDGMVSLTEKTTKDATELSKLITEYEKYQKQGKLTEDQQKKMNEVVGQIKVIAPGVVNAWDDMGTAIGINVDAAKSRLAELWKSQLIYAQGAQRLADLQVNISKDAKAKYLAEQKALTARQNAIYDLEGLYAKIGYENGTQYWDTRYKKTVDALKSGQIKTFGEAAAMLGQGWGKVTAQLNSVKLLIDDGIGQWRTLQGASVQEQLLAIRAWMGTDTLGNAEQLTAEKLLQVEQSLQTFNKYEIDASAAKIQVNQLTDAINELKKAMDKLDQEKLKINVPGTTTPGGNASLHPDWFQQYQREQTQGAALYNQYLSYIKGFGLEGATASLTGGGYSPALAFEDWAASITEGVQEWNQAFEQVPGMADDLLNKGNDFISGIYTLSELILDYDDKLMQSLGKGLDKLGDTLGGLIGSLASLGGEVGLIIMAFQVAFKLWDWIFKLLGWGPYAKEMSEGWRKFWEFLGFKTGTAEDDKRSAFQISEISGPMRDSIVSALDPLKVLYSYPTYKDEIVNAINAVRDVLSGADIGLGAARSGIQQTFNINTINITASNGETFSSIMRDLDRQAQLAAVAVGG